jgi:hypothetical protein
MYTTSYNVVWLVIMFGLAILADLEEHRARTLANTPKDYFLFVFYKSVGLFINASYKDDDPTYGYECILLSMLDLKVSRSVFL